VRDRQQIAVGGVCYPVPHDDTVAAITWVRDQAEDLVRGMLHGFLNLPAEVGRSGDASG